MLELSARDLAKMIADLCGVPEGSIDVLAVGTDGDFEAKTRERDERGGQQANIDDICSRMQEIYRLKITGDND